MTTASVPSLLCKVHVQCTHLLVSQVLQTDCPACISTPSYTASEGTFSLAKNTLTSFMLNDKGSWPLIRNAIINQHLYYGLDSL